MYTRTGVCFPVNSAPFIIYAAYHQLAEMSDRLKQEVSVSYVSLCTQLLPKLTSTLPHLFTKANTTSLKLFTIDVYK